MDDSNKSKKVLIMDDDAMILDVTTQILVMLNYKVVISHDGQEMIEIYKEYFNRGDIFDVVIMDLTVPGGMGGKEAIKELKKINKDVISIVSSGYSNDPVVLNFKDYGFSGVAQKPYKISDLKQLLETLI